jgi:hypothetical protein
MPKDLAIVLNNGSLNSAVATAIAAQKYRPVMLHGEPTPPGTSNLSRQRSAYDQQVAHFKPYREHTVSLPFLAMFEPTGSKSPAGLADPRQGASVAPTILNLLPLMAAAVRFAIHYRAGAIYLGLRVGGNTDELAQASEYIQIWSEIINHPLDQPDLDIQAPLLELDAWQVVDVGVNVMAPFERTWTCLEDGAEPCGACRGCRVREMAFQQAAKPDPMKPARR